MSRSISVCQRYVPGSVPVMVQASGTIITLHQSAPHDPASDPREDSARCEIQTDQAYSGIDASLDARTLVVWTEDRVGIIPRASLLRDRMVQGFETLCSQSITMTPSVARDMVEEEAAHLASKIADLKIQTTVCSKQIQLLRERAIELEAEARNAIGRERGASDFVTVSRARGKNRTVESRAAASRSHTHPLPPASKREKDGIYKELSQLEPERKEMQSDLQELLARSNLIEEQRKRLSEVADECSRTLDAGPSCSGPQYTRILLARISLSGELLAVMTDQCIHIFELYTMCRQSRYELTTTVPFLEPLERQEPILEIDDVTRSLAWVDPLGNVRITPTASSQKQKRVISRSRKDKNQTIQALKFSQDGRSLVLGLTGGEYLMVRLDTPIPRLIGALNLRGDIPNQRRDLVTTSSGSVAIPLGESESIYAFLLWTGTRFATHILPTRIINMRSSGIYRHLESCTTPSQIICENIQTIGQTDSFALYKNVSSLESGREVASICSRLSCSDEALLLNEESAIVSHMKSIEKIKNPPCARRLVLEMLGIVLDHTQLLMRQRFPSSGEEGPAAAVVAPTNGTVTIAVCTELLEVNPANFFYRV